MKLRKPSVLAVNWVSSCLSFFLSASTAAATTYIFTAPNCTTTIISLEPCALNAEYQQFILRSIKYMRGEEIEAPTINCTRLFRSRKWPLPHWTRGLKKITISPNSIIQRPKRLATRRRRSIFASISHHCFVKYWQRMYRSGPSTYKSYPKGG